MPRRRECFCPSAILRCAHVDGDVVQAWRSAGGSYVIEGPNGPGKAYRSLGIPTAVIADIDLLSDLPELNRTLQSVGAEPVADGGRFRNVRNSLRDIPSDSANHVEDLKQSAEAAEVSGDITKEVRSNLKRLLDDTASWFHAKRGGISELRGDARTDADEFLNDWGKAGLFVVPVGELEGWYPRANKKGWFAEASSALSSDPDQFDAVRGFLRRVAGQLRGSDS